MELNVHVLWTLILLTCAYKYILQEELEFKDMSPLFELPVEDASKRLSRTPLEIRTRCRELGFSWPRGDVSTLACCMIAHSFVLGNIFHFPPFQIDRYRKQIKHYEVLLEKSQISASTLTGATATDPAVLQTLRQQIVDAKAKIDILYRNPGGR